MNTGAPLFLRVNRQQRCQPEQIQVLIKHESVAMRGRISQCSRRSGRSASPATTFTRFVPYNEQAARDRLTPARRHGRVLSTSPAFLNLEALRSSSAELVGDSCSPTKIYNESAGRAFLPTCILHLYRSRHLLSGFAKRHL